MIVLDWHGFRCGLAGEDAIAQELSAHITHVGIPMHHTDPYVNDMVDAGFQIVRTMEPPWNAGRPGLAEGNLGKILLEYNDQQNPGKFFTEYAANLKDPIDGIGWNMEHGVFEINLTSEDRKYWDKYAKNLNLVDLRCQQFALILRLYQKSAQWKFKKPIPTFAYSGYQGITYNRRDTIQQAYGVDWNALAQPVAYRGLVYPPVDYAVCAWHGLELPATAIQRPPGLKILHNLGLPEYEPQKQRFADYEKMLRNRLKVRGPEDGLAIVACSPMTGPWNYQEENLRGVLRKVLG